MADRRPVGSTDEQIAQLIEHKSRKFARHPALREWTPEDLEQTMRVLWLEKGRQLDSRRGDVVTFADVLFNNLLKNLIIAQCADKRDYRRCTQSLDDPVESTEESGLTRHEVYSEEIYFGATGGRHEGRGQIADLRLDLRRVLERLPPWQRDLAIRLATQSTAEAAAELGIARQTASMWKRQIREAFRQAGLAVYLPGASKKSRKKPQRAT